MPRLALTATADDHTRADIIQRLALESARVFVAIFDRPNIRYTIVEKDDPRKQQLRFIRDEHEGPDEGPDSVDSGIVPVLPCSGWHEEGKRAFEIPILHTPVLGAQSGVAARAAPMQPALALRWAHQVALGLGALHQAGLRHLDLKPANLLLTPPGPLGQRIKIADFGACLSIRVKRHRFLGTPGWAPEQLHPVGRDDSGQPQVSRCFRPAHEVTCLCWGSCCSVC